MHQTSALSRRRLLVATSALFAPSLFAQSAKPLRLLVPSSAGSATDAVARAATTELSNALGRSIVIENVPAAGGVLGTQMLLAAPPDGSTLSLVPANHVILPSVYKSVTSHPVNDFTPVALIGAGRLVLVVNPKVPASNARELVALMKSQPDARTYASAGQGSILHLAAEIVLAETGTSARHIPYNGTAGMMTDVLGGQVDMCVAGLSQALPHIKSGAVRAIGVVTSRRVAVLHDVPTFVEQGFPNAICDGWVMLIGPKGVPAAEVQRLNAAVMKAFNSPEVVSAMEKQGIDLELSTAGGALEFLKAEYAKMSMLAQKVGLVAK